MRDGVVRIHVDDDGIGIPEAERENVFTAFTRLDRSRDRTTGGYGLGLAIARLVLELHGGTATAHASRSGSPLHAELARPARTPNLTPDSPWPPQAEVLQTGPARRLPVTKRYKALRKRNRRALRCPVPCEP